LYTTKTMSLVESELAKLVSGLSQLDLNPQIEYAVLSEGKRLRPLLVIFSAECVGGKRDKALRLALGFEMMHTATLVHDDIIDQDETRRAMPSVYKKWSVNDAILTGDALIALAVDLASEYGETIMKTVARSALDLCDGEHMDITFSPKMVNQEAYFRKIRKKSASLFAAAAYCGALAGGGTLSEANTLSAFGENFGIAYQLRDDLLDSTCALESIPKDLKATRLTFPLIHLYEVSNSERREELENYLRLLSEEDKGSRRIAAERIQVMLAKSGSIAYCKRSINEYVQKSVQSIMPLRDTVPKLCLIKMTESLVA